MTPIVVCGQRARVEDLDGNWLIENGIGLRAITLGHGYEPVVAAVRNAAAEGVNSSRPKVWELRAAEDFLEQVSGAEMVKFTKSGSDTTTAAIKLARAITGRDLVAICATQPFFSIDDWFIATTHMAAGSRPPTAH
jgi:glutamate-1-semialdehyde 2,1-aminomutase